MTHTQTIQERMEVVGSCGAHVGTVDHVEGESIKLTRSDSAAQGEHHFIPLDWVASVDDKVHLSKACDEVQREWQNAPMATSM